jgi:hypothetical protein
VTSKKEKLPLSVTHPELAKEADGWDTSKVSAGSSRKLSWKCPKDHIYQAHVFSRTARGDGCPYCSGRRVIAGENDFLSTHPELASEAFDWDPTEYSFGSQKAVKWKCRQGHVFQSRIANRAINGSSCPYCSNNLVLAGFNDLATTHPEVASQADGWDPATVSAGSGRIQNWKCSLGHQWSNSPHVHLKSRTGCPICANKRVLEGFNDLATTHPELAREAYGWDPKSIVAGHDKKKSWKCPSGHVYESRPYQRTGSKESGCPICDNKQILPGFNDIATTYPEMARQADGWDPRTISAGHNTRKKWKCELGHTWEVSPQNRFQTRGAISNCPVCSGDKLWVGFNDLATKHPELAGEAFGWDPTSIIAGHTKRKWKCLEGHIWMASTISRIGSQVGCPTCSKTGFDPNRDGFLYFLEHKHWSMLQVGITNNPEKRLGQHRKLGWEPLELRGPMDGHLTQQWETAILRMLKVKGADLSNEKIAGKFDGYSEAWSKTTFEVSSIKELMRITEEFEADGKTR